MRGGNVGRVLVPDERPTLLGGLADELLERQEHVVAQKGLRHFGHQVAEDELADAGASLVLDRVRPFRLVPDRKEVFGGAGPACQVTLLVELRHQAGALLAHRLQVLGGDDTLQNEKALLLELVQMIVGEQHGLLLIGKIVLGQNQADAGRPSVSTVAQARAAPVSPLRRGPSAIKRTGGVQAAPVAVGLVAPGAARDEPVAPHRSAGSR